MSLLVLNEDSSVDITFNTVSVSVELLLSGHKLLVKDSMLILVRSKHHVNPSCDVLNSSLCILPNFLLGLFEAETKEDLRFDS
jgi:hypothetical protein